MQPKEIQERNKDIAIMLGLIPLESPYLGAYRTDENTHHVLFYQDRMEDESWYVYASYNSDWNWLFEAVEFVNRKYTTIISSSHCEIHMYDNGKIPINIGANTTILATFIAISDFAKQYNLSKSNE